MTNRFRRYLSKLWIAPATLLFLLFFNSELKAANTSATQSADNETGSSVPAHIALIMDDIGYRQSDRLALSLPLQIAFSILPDAPLAQELAQRANQQGREIMLHLPMAAYTQANLGPIALTADMSAEQIGEVTHRALNSVPMAIGVNNHMGSWLTEKNWAMHEVMKTIKTRGLFFVDSRTTSESVAESTARELGLPVARRHVFIDHRLSPESMQQQFSRLIALAHQQSLAIGIVHPHPQTLAFLKQQFETLGSQQIQLIPISHAIKPSLPTEPAQTQKTMQP
ncbi:divergent polysaccharide deacetylase family protein [Alteromonas lipotrueiana]|uniref:divergent polysaccharide deacetylase family protein n=1 Tax=Alteromonas lipotrueiana TaxID=2803815 RepID=UPI001C451996